MILHLWGRRKSMGCGDVAAPRAAPSPIRSADTAHAPVQLVRSPARCSRKLVCKLPILEVLCRFSHIEENWTPARCSVSGGAGCSQDRGGRSKQRIHPSRTEALRTYYYCSMPQERYARRRAFIRAADPPPQRPSAPSCLTSLQHYKKLWQSATSRPRHRSKR